MRSVETLDIPRTLSSSGGPARRLGVLLATACLALAATACTTMGSGQGHMAATNAPVNFAWTSTDGGSTGTMSARLPDGRAFNGPFVQLTNSVRVETLEPIWHGWRRGWVDWGGLPETTFATQYTSRVVANLQGPDSNRMRCRFNLNDPASGMGGGGVGQCQLLGQTGGAASTIDASFTRG